LAIFKNTDNQAIQDKIQDEILAGKLYPSKKLYSTKKYSAQDALLPPNTQQCESINSLKSTFAIKVVTKKIMEDFRF